MKLSESWLRSWANPIIDHAALVHQLTMAGLEIDGVEAAAPAFSGIMIGEVKELTAHPDADKLRIGKVDVGQPELLQIVCGAPNVAVGMRVPTAVIGAVLPGDFKIKRAKLRGVESQGMMCSARELGLSEDHAGLMALPADAPIGQDIREYLQLDDQILEISLTPNRGDCLSIAGVAREIGVLNRCAVQAVEPVTQTVSSMVTPQVQVAVPADCPRYLARVIEKLDPAAQSPQWLTERLRRSGIRTHGALVDVTNYVLLELGQPLHAFDYAKVQGSLVIRRAQTQEPLILLDGAKVALNPDTLVIADDRGAIAIAGIMGGESTACGDTTSSVLLEAAFFNPITIAGRARSYGLQTDASHHFERGVDFDLPLRALERATELLLQIAGGEVGPIVEVTSAADLPQRCAIPLRQQRADQLLGMQIDPAEIEDILQRQGINVQKTGTGMWQATPPSWRFDIEQEVDLIEEIARIHGYDEVPEHHLSYEPVMHRQSEAQIALDRFKHSLIQQGFDEAITLSFVPPETLKTLTPETETLALLNPIAADLAVMRTTLWAGLLKAVDYNRKRQQSRIRLFESGLIFSGSDPKQLQQQLVLGGVITGSREPEQWGSAAVEVDFYDLKGHLENLFALTGDAASFRMISAVHPALHPGQSARIERNDQVVGWMGKLHPKVAKKLDLEGAVFVFELDVALLSVAQIPQFSEVSRFPASKRDLALLVEEFVTFEAIAATIRQEAGSLLRSCELFDLYCGKGIPAGYKSLAISLYFQDIATSLTDEQVEQIVNKVVTTLDSRLGATLRN